MNMENKDQSAFPMKEGKQANGQPRYAQYGLTKREYFAAMAMQGILANPECNASIEGYVKDAIKYADELLTQLNNSK
jgi:hypothetical protein